MGRGVSSGGGQSSLGYLFGSGGEPSKSGDENPKPNNPKPTASVVDNSKQIPAGIPGNTTNNYFRADGQNTGNFITFLMDPAEELRPDLPPMEEMTIRAIESNILDYRFKNKRLLEEALTNASFYLPSKSPDPFNNSLKFVGNSVLVRLIAREIFHNFSNLTPVQRALLRTVNLNAERLSRIAVTSGLHQYLRHKSPPQLELQVKEFMAGMKEYPIHSYGILYPPKLLADMVQSVIGAVYIDSNRSLKAAWKVLRRLAEPFINPDTLEKYPMSELLELCEKNGMNYSVVSTWEEDETVKFYINGVLFGSASYSDKKEIAHNRAAKAALGKLKEALMKEPGLN